MPYPRNKNKALNIALFANLFLFIFTGFSFAVTDELWSIPDNIQSKVLSSRVKNNISIQEITYIPSYFKGKPVTIFAYFCYPLNLKKAGMPGVVLVHGGAGRADLNRALAWANKGYAAISMDLPGKGEKRGNSRSTGLDMDVSILLRVQPDLSYNYLYHAVRTARGGISYLKQTGFVSDVAMVGLSWGGVITLLTNGIDDRLAAAVPVFGSGFLDEGSTWQEWFDQKMKKSDLQTYINNFDARQYLTTQHAPLFYLTGTNDHCFFLPIFLRSCLMLNVPCTLYLNPNGGHFVDDKMQDLIFQWVDYMLKKAPAFPNIQFEDASYYGGFIWFRIKASSSNKLDSIRLYYSKSGVSKWTVKKWEYIDANKKGLYFMAKLAASLISPEVLFYCTAIDLRGAQASTPVYSILKLKIDDGRLVYITTEPIDRIFEHKISRTVWVQIFKKDPPTPMQFLPISYVWRAGGKLTRHNDAYYLGLTR